jgi:hypothetical protein
MYSSGVFSSSLCSPGPSLVQVSVLWDAEITAQSLPTLLLLLLFSGRHLQMFNNKSEVGVTRVNKDLIWWKE